VVVCRLVLAVCLRLANGVKTGCAYRALNADQDVCTGGIHETSGSGFHAGGVASRSCRSAFGSLQSQIWPPALRVRGCPRGEDMSSPQAAP